MTFAVGSLVRARGREWVVLPDSGADLLMLRPLGGADDEVTGIYLPLESVEPARFPLPDPADVGDFRSGRLLRDAVRLGFRASAGPFRSFARIAVEPRPYQLVPLLMALRLDPVRLLVADDVGIGKTIEACLIARELLDRGEVRRLAVLCPPHLAEQWQDELDRKFHIEAELVLASTATRLERDCAVGQSLFDIYPHVVVSTDFIKAERRREEFLRTCPELVIVDEAHTCAFDTGARGRHQRHELLRRLAGDPKRHLILVTATPHSGKEEAFRSLLALLDPAFASLPEDLSGRENEPHRRRLAAHFVQRRRGDIRRYLDTETLFPARDDREETYALSPQYKALFERALSYARETVRDPEGNRHRQRVRWWSALALLRSLASSPAAAAATLRSRARAADTGAAEEADEIGQRSVLDQDDVDSAEDLDVVPGGDSGEYAVDESANRRRLLDMAREAESLKGSKDAKLVKAAGLVEQLLAEGHNPIVFCRFIPTAEYVAEYLRGRLKKVEVAAVTGTLPPAEREARVAELAEAPRHVLVCTDCLSEGINLQNHFDAVVHYDLSWNPTRHEQREGRVDRYGQPTKTVRVVMFYGIDNQIDGIVLDVLLRKHRTIRSSLGIAVPVPVDTNQVIEAVFEGLLLRERAGSSSQALLPGLEEFLRPQREDLHRQWDAAATATERDRRSRTMFAQEAIKVEDVARELAAVRAAIGSRVDVRRFVEEALAAHGAIVHGGDPVKIDLREVVRPLRETIAEGDEIVARFELPVEERVAYLERTHPVVERLAGYVMDTALGAEADGRARRAGAIRTTAVDRRTTLLLVRFRYHLLTRRGADDERLLAEDCVTLAFEGAPESPTWLEPARAEALLGAAPAGNVTADQARDFVARVVEGFASIRPHVDRIAAERGRELLDAHRRVRQAASMRGVSQRVEPVLPADVLGVYVYLPVGLA